MATVGTFKKSGNELIGEIVTSVSRRETFASSRKPIAPRERPSHRVFVGRADIGAAWASAPTRVAAILAQATTRPSRLRSTTTSSAMRTRRAIA